MSEPSAAALFLPASRGLRGTITVPGDKSISHRALLFGAINDGPLAIEHFLESADTMATLEAIRALGVQVDAGAGRIVVHGRGWEGLQEPKDVIDAANSGTLIRLLPGIVASLPMLSVITGDASIRRRPMRRILQPLAAMGATVLGRDEGTLPPVVIRGAALKGITHEMPIASAQVKSCILLAGLRAYGPTTIVEPGPSRDHTELLIRHGGGRVEREGPVAGPGRLRVWPVARLHLDQISVPGDFSSSAFFLVAALIVDDSEITVQNVGLNPSRTGLLPVLQRMAADISVHPYENAGVEPRGRLTARTSSLVATDVDASEVPLLIDELPLFLLAAAKATGTSRLRGAAELRAKESDRLRAMAALLTALGVTVREHPDGMDVVGDPNGWKRGVTAAEDDHRVAMVGAVAGAASLEGVVVDDTTCMSVSYPGFMDALRALGGSWTAAPDGAAEPRAQ